MASLTLLSLACCLPATLAAVLELPVRLENGYAMVEVQAGTPAVSHSLLFDTGSATTWMIRAECDGTSSCPNTGGYDRTGYNQSASSTAQDMGTTGSIAYLGGSIEGTGVEDVVAVANTTWAQSFMAVNKSSWSNIPADGFLGLAFDTISDANTTTVVETLMRDGRLDEPRFGLYYGVEATDTGGVPGDGVLTLGGSDEDTYVDGNMTWAPLATPGDNAQVWRVNMQYMESTKPGNTSSTGGYDNTIGLSGAWGVFDTGAGRTSVPDPYIEAIYASIGMNYTAIIKGDHIPLCTEFTDAWSVRFYFGDAYEPVALTLTGDMLRSPGFATGEDKYCWPPFDASGSNGLFLFGNDMLQLFYTVWDYGAFEPAGYAARFGFGGLKDEYRPNVGA